MNGTWPCQNHWTQALTGLQKAAKSKIVKKIGLVFRKFFLLTELLHRVRYV